MPLRPNLAVKEFLLKPLRPALTLAPGLLQRPALLSTQLAQKLVLGLG